MGSKRIPSIVFCIYQLMLAAITCVLPHSVTTPRSTSHARSSRSMLALGGFAERAHLGSLLFFVFTWSTLVYDPIAYWTWNANGWGNKIGNLDFAGGTPVHIASGTASLAISFFLKKRRGYGTADLVYTPHNTTYVVLGTVFLWFGWFGV